MHCRSGAQEKEKVLALQHLIEYNTYRSHWSLHRRTPMEIIQQWSAEIRHYPPMER